jgi:hypothetical protein
MMRTAARWCGIVLLSCATQVAWAADAEDSDYFGLLRTRDITPFGFLRLDMRPTHARIAPEGSWGVETELAYQNTWALSPNVENYLSTLSGRRDLGPADADAIRALPGENYLVDLELALLDVTFHYKFSSQWAAYLVLSGSWYGGGFLDSTIESFHDVFGFDDFGRPAVRRDDFNYILDLKGTQATAFELPNDGGMLDPTIGVRYSGISLGKNWKVIFEAAAKLPLQGQRDLLSTGLTDYGVQMTFQRFADQHAWYIAPSVVYFAGSPDLAPTDSDFIPTLVLGYERHLGANTHLILQGYVSPSVWSGDDTDLDDLRATKYQATLGLYHRIGAGLITFGITENLQNLNNTPDIGFQLGLSFSPALLAPPGK